MNENEKKLLSDIECLPNVDCKCDFGDIVRAFADYKINDDLKFKVQQIALNLRPWRKGPFEILETFIDSEWQSFMKFNLLKPFMDLQGKKVADIGCNNGYYLFRMSNFGAKKLIGFDPGVRTFLQFRFLEHFLKSGVIYELLGVENLPDYGEKFDSIFCLGVLYHRSDPVRALKELKSSLNSGGEVFLDTMFIDGNDEICLFPRSSYAKISNIYFLPTIRTLQNWCERAKFKDFEILAVKATDENEQRKTDWIYGQSLGDFLDPFDKTRTIEGYPAPKRVYVRVKI